MLTTWFEKLVVEHGSSVVQGKFIDLLKARLVEVEKEYGDLQKENSRLVEENANLLRQIEAYRASEKFVEHLGAAFKLDGEGGDASETVYCPNCHRVMSPSIMDGGFICVPCGHRSKLKQHEVAQAIEYINRRTVSK